MIVERPEDLTAAVLAELERADDARWRTIMQSAVRHLHGFVRDTALTEAEFQKICAVIARLGQLTGPSHNEVVLGPARSVSRRWSACSTTAPAAPSPPPPICWALSGESMLPLRPTARALCEARLQASQFL